MTTPSKSTGTPSKQRRTPAKQTPGSTQRTRTTFAMIELIYLIFSLAAKRRNPLTALQEDEPITSPAPSSVLQMPFTPGRTPNKNRGSSRLYFYLNIKKNSFQEWHFHP
jgi:hypothetical protein